MHWLALLLLMLPMLTLPELWWEGQGTAGQFLNLSFPTGDDEESLKCSRCHGLFCSEISLLQEHCRDNVFSWRCIYESRDMSTWPSSRSERLMPHTP